MSVFHSLIFILCCNSLIYPLSRRYQLVPMNQTHMDLSVQKEKIINFLKQGATEFLPQISLDCVIFAFTGKRLVILGTQPIENGPWFIPGDFILQKESIDEAAYRSLKTKMGLSEIFLRQFKTFGEANRSFATEMSSLFTQAGIDPEHFAWMTKRFVTIGYYACVEYGKVQLQPSPFFQNIAWIDIDDLDRMGFDHADIVLEARKILAKDLTDLPVIAKLLPETFTIPELQKLHEAILGREIDRGNFRQKILKTGILEKIGERHTPSTRRPPGVYRFNWKHYEAKLEEGVKIGF